MSTQLHEPPPLTGGQKTVGDSLVVDQWEIYRQSHEAGGLGSVSVGDGNDDDCGDRVDVRVDWLSVTFKPTPGLPIDEGQVQLAVALALACEVGDWVELDHGSYGYRQGMVGPGGARIYWDAPGRDDIHASLPGQACELAGEARMRRFLAYVQAHHGKPTRVDMAMDDYGHVVSPGQVLEALQGEDVVTHAQSGLVHRGFQVGSRELIGETTYLGAPSSRQRLRVYDKGLESGGEVDAVRWELQSRVEAAETLVMALLAAESWGELFARRLVGFVDFRDRESHSEVEKRSRLPWFQALVAGAKKASAYLAKPARTLNEVVDWLDWAMGPTLAVAMRFWRGDMGELVGIIRRGEERWKPKHRAMLAVAGVS